MSSFKTLDSDTEILYKDRNSKFYGYAFPISSEEDFKSFAKLFKEKYPDAGHHCYAFRIGETGATYRYSDDGEPSNSAGKPIYGQLLSSGITNSGVIVARYFGGTKLGVGGLINAYREAARLAIEENEIINDFIRSFIQIEFDYSQTSILDQILNDFDFKETKAEFSENCLKVIALRSDQAEGLLEQLTSARIEASIL